MKLYYTKGACSLVVRIILNELAMVCQFEAVDLKNKKTEKGEDFLSINPKGAVPTLQLDDGRVLTENAVILQYLADEKKAIHLLPAVGQFERYRVLEWVNYITTEIHKSFGALFNPNVPDDLKESLFIPLLKKKFDYIDNALANQNYLMGEHFTLPDAYLFVMLRWALSFKIAIKEFTALSHYYTRLQQYPAILRSLNDEGLSAIQ